MLRRNRRGRALNAPAAFIHPCRPTVAKQPPSGPGWAHELKHDGYRLQIHIRDGRTRLYTMNGYDWTERYPLIVTEAARIKGNAILDCEVICADESGVPNFDLLHSRRHDHLAVACAFDLLMFDGQDMRQRCLFERKTALGRLLKDDVRLGDGSGPWFWTITAREQPPSVYNHGYAASREQAMRYPRPTQRLFRLALESHTGRAFSPIPKRSTSLRATSTP